MNRVIISTFHNASWLKEKKKLSDVRISVRFSRQCRFNERVFVIKKKHPVALCHLTMGHFTETTHFKLSNKYGGIVAGHVIIIQITPSPIQFKTTQNVAVTLPVYGNQSTTSKDSLCKLSLIEIIGSANQVLICASSLAVIMILFWSNDHLVTSLKLA